MGRVVIIDVNKATENEDQEKQKLQRPSIFSSVETVIEPLNPLKAYKSDICSEKINLISGWFKSSNDQPWIMPVVKIAEKALSMDDTIDTRDAPIFGVPLFGKLVSNLILGQSHKAIRHLKVATIQTLSATGAFRIGAEFLAGQLGYHTLIYSDPSTENYEGIFGHSGFVNFLQYRYWSYELKAVNIATFLEDLERAEVGSVVILDCCSHIPTGTDPTKAQWVQIANVIQKRKIFPFFTSSNIGFASGDIDQDAWAIRYFVDRGFELFCAHGFSPSFGLHGERVGALLIVTNNNIAIPFIKSQFEIIIRAMYNMPPCFGARIVAYILNNTDLKKQWLKKVQQITQRNMNVKTRLQSAVESLGTPGNWNYISKQVGFYCYTGLTDSQINYMRIKYHIYMIRCGSMNTCGISDSNVEYIARAISAAVKSVDQKVLI